MENMLYAEDIRAEEEGSTEVTEVREEENEQVKKKGRKRSCQRKSSTGIYMHTLYIHVCNTHAH